MRNGVRERSRAAVAKAGARERRAPSESARSWRPEGGLRAQGPFRPGKTTRKKGTR